MLFLILIVEIYASKTILTKENVNTTSKSDVLSREKRFLTFVPGTASMQFVMGYLGPIDIPSWQNINCLRNYRAIYDLPQKWYTKFSHFPGFKARSEGRSLNEGSQVKTKPDSTRKIAYEVVEDMLNR